MPSECFVLFSHSWNAYFYISMHRWLFEMITSASPTSVLRHGCRYELSRLTNVRFEIFLLDKERRSSINSGLITLAIYLARNYEPLIHNPLFNVEWLHSHTHWQHIAIHKMVMFTKYRKKNIIGWLAALSFFQLTLMAMWQGFMSSTKRPWLLQETPSNDLMKCSLLPGMWSHET